MLQGRGLRLLAICSDRIANNANLAVILKINWAEYARENVYFYGYLTGKRIANLRQIVCPLSLRGQTI